jgi:hypothetical protein
LFKECFTVLEENDKGRKIAICFKLQATERIAKITLEGAASNISKEKEFISTKTVTPVRKSPDLDGSYAFHGQQPPGTSSTSKSKLN